MHFNLKKYSLFRLPVLVPLVQSRNFDLGVLSSSPMLDVEIAGKKNNQYIKINFISVFCLFVF